MLAAFSSDTSPQSPPTQQIHARVTTSSSATTHHRIAPASAPLQRAQVL